MNNLTSMNDKLNPCNGIFQYYNEMKRELVKIHESKI